MNKKLKKKKSCNFFFKLIVVSAISNISEMLLLISVCNYISLLFHLSCLTVCKPYCKHRKN